MNLIRPFALSLGVFLALPLLAKDAPTYPSAEAKNHLGEHASVVGKVGGVHETSKGDVFINLGPAYPDNDFTAVIFVADRDKFGEVDLLEGKTITVTGTIKEYRGKPEMILNQADQLKVKSG